MLRSDRKLLSFDFTHITSGILNYVDFRTKLHHWKKLLVLLEVNDSCDSQKKKKLVSKIQTHRVIRLVGDRVWSL